MKIKEIASRDNPVFRQFMRLFRGQGVRKYGMAFLSGPKQVAEVLRDFPQACRGVVLPKEMEIPAAADSADITAYRLLGPLFREVDQYGTNRPILLVRVPPMPPWVEGDPHAGCTLFVPFQDPTNVGAVLRSAAAFGVDSVVMLREAAHPFHPKSVRVAGSALFRLAMIEGPSIGELEMKRLPLFTLAPRGRDIGGFEFPAAFGLLPGLEGPGLPRSLEGLPALAVPIEPCVESLNAAVATGIALYVWRSRKGRVVK